jgi:hypothetical protein
MGADVSIYTWFLQYDILSEWAVNHENQSYFIILPAANHKFSYTRFWTGEVAAVRRMRAHVGSQSSETG